MERKIGTRQEWESGKSDFQFDLLDSARRNSRADASNDQFQKIENRGLSESCSLEVSFGNLSKPSANHSAEAEAIFNLSIHNLCKSEWQESLRVIGNRHNSKEEKSQIKVSNKDSHARKEFRSDDESRDTRQWFHQPLLEHFPRKFSDCENSSDKNYGNLLKNSLFGFKKNQIEPQFKKNESKNESRGRRKGKMGSKRLLARRGKASDEAGFPKLGFIPEIVDSSGVSFQNPNQLKFFGLRKQRKKTKRESQHTSKESVKKANRIFRKKKAVKHATLQRSLFATANEVPAQTKDETHASQRHRKSKRIRKCAKKKAKVKKSNIENDNTNSQKEMIKERDQIWGFMELMFSFCEEVKEKIKLRKDDGISTGAIVQMMISRISDQKQSESKFLMKNFPFKMAEIFTIQDIEQIQRLFSLSQELLAHNRHPKDYFIDRKTKEVFIKLRPGDSDTANEPMVDQTNLISLVKFQRTNWENQRSSVNKTFLQCLLGQSPKQALANRPKPINFKSRQITRKKVWKRRQNKGCNCSKSKCLRLHCVCFRDGTFCGRSCGCKGCYNTPKFKRLVAKVRVATKDINSSAFESRLLDIEIQGKVCKITKGCSCSRNNCLKNYCECRKNGLGCSALCKCENCQNFKVDLDPALANSLYKNPSRKKKKIIFQKNSKDSLEMVEKVLMNKYRRV